MEKVWNKVRLCEKVMKAVFFEKLLILILHTFHVRIHGFVQPGIWLWNQNVMSLISDEDDNITLMKEKVNKITM